jgi:hypothetical protein
MKKLRILPPRNRLLDEFGSTSHERVFRYIENGDARFCNWDSTAAACAIERRCSKSKEQLPELDAWELACGQAEHQECALPGKDPGYVPIPNQATESFNIYSPSTLNRNFEIGSSQVHKS